MRNAPATRSAGAMRRKSSICFGCGTSIRISRVRLSSSGWRFTLQGCIVSQVPATIVAAAKPRVSTLWTHEIELTPAPIHPQAYLRNVLELRGHGAHPPRGDDEAYFESRSIGADTSFVIPANAGIQMPSERPQIPASVLTLSVITPIF